MIYLKTAADIEAMRKAGRVSAKALRKTGELVRPGISTLDLDRFAENLIRMEGGIPAFLGYGGFRGSICSSLNNQIVHGIPSSEVILKEGDILSIDVGAIVGGWVGDNAATFAVGAISPQAQRLLDVTKKSLYAGIEAARTDNYLGDIGHAIQRVAENAAFNVVREYVGHGVGRVMHEPPNVPNFGKQGKGLKLKPGLVIAIEPMVNAGSGATRGPYEDMWTVFSADNSLSAHFEHTIAVTADGPLILTAE